VGLVLRGRAGITRKGITAPPTSYIILDVGGAKSRSRDRFPGKGTHGSEQISLKRRRKVRAEPQAATALIEIFSFSADFGIEAKHYVSSI
jgi:hypothetical protein